MTSRDFCYWLQGYFELIPSSYSGSLDTIQVQKIKNHLAMVFAQVDKTFGDKSHQDFLKTLHGGALDAKVNC